MIKRAGVEKRQNVRFTLSDPSENMLNEAKKKLEGKKNRFMNLASHEFEFESEYDVITAVQCHHYYRPEEREKAIRFKCLPEKQKPLARIGRMSCRPAQGACFFGLSARMRFARTELCRQPFTAPATMPLMIWLEKAKYSTTMGLMVISMAVICSG